MRYAGKGVETRNGSLGDEDGVLAIVDPEGLLGDLTERNLGRSDNANNGWKKEWRLHRRNYCIVYPTLAAASIARLRRRWV